MSHGECPKCGGPRERGRCYGCGPTEPTLLPVVVDPNPGPSGMTLEPTTHKSVSVGRRVTGRLVRNARGWWEVAK